MSESARIWLVILGLGVGTFAIRLSFLGLIGNRQLPGWACGSCAMCRSR